MLIGLNDSKNFELNQTENKDFELNKTKNLTILGDFAP